MTSPDVENGAGVDSTVDNCGYIVQPNFFQFKADSP